jgi:hypothetical protein
LRAPDRHATNDGVIGKFTGLEKMITRRVGLEDIVRDGFEELIHNKDEHIKILISPKMKDFSK